MRNTGTLKVTARGDREIVMTRVFDAPRRVVFDALTKPELLKRWFGPHGWSMAVCEVDLRVGGTFRFVLQGPNGREMGMRGVYREIVPPERSVHMESFDDYPGESEVTTVLVEQGGKTTLTATVLSPSPEVREAVLKSGMEHGAAESYDRLAELLASSGDFKESSRIYFLIDGWIASTRSTWLSKFASLIRNGLYIRTVPFLSINTSVGVELTP